jgi:hypothetical protein
MTMDNILSGLLGSVIGGLIGAIVGFFGSRRLQRDADKTQQQAAARAVLAEMSTNLERALDAESTRQIHEFFDAAWRSQLPMVAQLLKWPDLKKLISVYDYAARAYENSLDVLRHLEDQKRELGSKSPVMGEELQSDRKLASIEGRRRRIDQWFRQIANEWIAAMSLVSEVALGREERKAFDDDLRKLDERLRSANVLGEAG